MSTATISHTGATPSRVLGYKTLSIGAITCPKRLHIIPIDNFLRSLMREVAWGFSNGTAK